MSQSPQEGLVIIGQKPSMNYVIACLSIFNSDVPRVKIKARGLAICRAIETVMLLRKAFIKDLEIQNISIGTQEFSKVDEMIARVSTIDIILSKPKKI